MRRSIAVLTTLAATLSSGCGGGPSGPLLAGGRGVKSWVADLDSPKAAVRLQAVRKLGNVGDADPAAAEALLRGLQDSDAQVRRDAVFAVVKLRNPGAAIEARLDALSREDKDPKVRDVATRALTKLRGPG